MCSIIVVVENIYFVINSFLNTDRLDWRADVDNVKVSAVGVMEESQVKTPTRV